MNADFGHRSREETVLFDVGSTVGSINKLLGNVARWMRPGGARCGRAVLAGHEPYRLSAARRGRHRVAVDLSGGTCLDPARYPRSPQATARC
jgi:hypothetical protein